MKEPFRSITASLEKISKIGFEVKELAYGCTENTCTIGLDDKRFTFVFLENSLIDAKYILNLYYHGPWDTEKQE